MITDVIRNSDDEHTVYFLLTAYVESIRVGEQCDCVSEHATALPLENATDVRVRFKSLLQELDTASRNLDDQTCLVLRDAVHVFGTALERLIALERRQHSRLAA